MAEASELPVTLHDCTGPIVYAASCALSATLPNVNYQEAVRAYFTGWYTEIVDVLPKVENGQVFPLDGPGLGTVAEAGGVPARRRRASASSGSGWRHPLNGTSGSPFTPSPWMAKRPPGLRLAGKVARRRGGRSPT